MSSLKVDIELDHDQFRTIVSKLDRVIELLTFGHGHGHDHDHDHGNGNGNGDDPRMIVELTAKLKESETSLREVVAQHQPSTKL